MLCALVPFPLAKMAMCFIGFVRLVFSGTYSRAENKNYEKTDSMFLLTCSKFLQPYSYPNISIDLPRIMLKELFKKKEPEVIRDPTETDFCYYPFFQVL